MLRNDLKITLRVISDTTPKRGEPKCRNRRNTKKQNKLRSALNNSANDIHIQ
jgi:hypothetical protein